jgi:hypothetical protein
MVRAARIAPVTDAGTGFGRDALARRYIEARSIAAEAGSYKSTGIAL